MRYASRGQVGASTTGLVTNLVLAIPFTMACVLLSPFFARIAGTDQMYFVLASVQIFQLHLIPLFEHVATSKKPHLIAYDIILHEFTKIAAALLLVIYFKMELVGAILSVIVANTADICFFMAVLRPEFHFYPRWSYLRTWLKTSTLSIYGMIGGRIAGLDMMLLILFGGALSRALYGAASMITVLITYTATLSYALYPRLLSGGGSKDAEASIKLTTLIAIPALMGVITLAHPLLVVLNPVYESAYPILYILSIVAFLGSFSSIFESIISGTERVDAHPKFTIKDLVKSRLFILPTFSYIQAVIGLPILYFAFNRLTHSTLESALWCAMVSLILTSTFTISKLIISKRCLDFRFPMRTLLTSLAASAVMSAVLILIEPPARISYLFLFIAIGASIYFALASAIDRETRQLILRIVSNLRDMVLERSSYFSKERVASGKNP